MIKVGFAFCRTSRRAYLCVSNIPNIIATPDGYQSVIQANMLPRATVSQGLCISERSVLECAVRRGSNKTTNMIREPLRIYVSFFFLGLHCVRGVWVLWAPNMDMNWLAMSFAKVLNLFLQVIVFMVLKRSIQTIPRS